MQISSKKYCYWKEPDGWCFGTLYHPESECFLEGNQGELSDIDYGTLAFEYEAVGLSEDTAMKNCEIYNRRRKRL